MSILKKKPKKLYRAVNGSYFAYSFIMAIVVQVINVAFWGFFYFILFQGLVLMTFRNH